MPNETPSAPFPPHPPGVSRSGLCKKLSADTGLYYVAVGDFLREHAANNPLIKESVESGGTKGRVPGDVLMPLLFDQIAEVMRAGKKDFLLDSFPRSFGQDRQFRDALCAR